MENCCPNVLPLTIIVKELQVDGEAGRNFHAKTQSAAAFLGLFFASLRLCVKIPPQEHHRSARSLL